MACCGARSAKLKKLATAKANRAVAQREKTGIKPKKTRARKAQPKKGKPCTVCAKR
jgi:hypothetical protein